MAKIILIRRKVLDVFSPSYEIVAKAHQLLQKLSKLAKIFLSRRNSLLRRLQFFLNGVVVIWEGAFKGIIFSMLFPSKLIPRAVYTLSSGTKP